MFEIFLPVFESVWKRKETKIYLFFAFIYPLLILFSSFLPKGNNFLVPHGYFTFDVYYSLLIYAVNDFILPVLALFYLTYTVFKGEVVAHTMYLYKDITRSKIFWSKILSLFIIVLIFLVLFTISMLAVYYGRLVQNTEVFSTGFFNIEDTDWNRAIFYDILVFLFDCLLCIFISSTVSLYSGVGFTMVVAFIYSIGKSILNILGFIYITPNGLRDEIIDGMGLISAICYSLLPTLIFSIILVFISKKYFKNIEY